MISNLKKLSGDKGFIKLIVANFISTFGSSIDDVAFSWLVYELTGSPIWIALIFGASTIPRMVLQSFVGVFVERYNKKSVILFCDFFGAIIMAILFSLYVLDILNPVLLLVITLANGMIETIRTPAGVAFAPQILSEKNYNIGLGINQSMGQIASIIGLAITGVIIATLGLHFAFLIDGLTFLISLVVIFSIKCEKENKKVGANNFLSEYKQGIKKFIKSPKIVRICMLCVMFNFISVPISTYSAIYIGDYLEFSVEIFSYYSIASTVGTIIGGLISSVISDKINSKKVFMYACILQGIIYLSLIFDIFVLQNGIKIAILLASALAFGALNGVLGVNISVEFIKAVPSEYLARMSGIFNSIATVATPITSLGLALISAYFKINVIFLCFAIFSFIFSVLILIKYKIVEE